MSLDRHFLRNVSGISLVEVLWGLGMPTVFESTFLQLFLRHLGASGFLIGLIPTLSSAGVALSAFFSYTLTGHLERKRTVVIVIHAITATPLLAFGVILGVTGTRSSTLGLFLVLYAAFSISLGLILPAWQNYIVKIFSERNAVPAVSVMLICQTAARLAGSLFLVRVVERYSFSAAGASLVFTMVGLLFLVGSFPFLLTVESAGGSAPASTAVPEHRPSLRRVFRNRDFLLFLGTDIEYFALAGVIAFYAVYATEFCGIDPALASGLFVTFSCLGGVFVNGVLGWANLLSLRMKYLVTKSVTTAAVVLLAFHSTLWVFLLASFLMGASRGTRSMVFVHAIKRISGQSDATLYFSVAPILVLPLSTGLPLLNGAFLDQFAGLGAWSYRLVFLAMAALGITGIFFAARMRKE